MSKLQKIFIEEVTPKLKEKYGIVNKHCLPKIEKVIVSMRLGKGDNADKKAIEAAANELSAITGYKPAYAKARRSIAGFKVIKGQTVGLYCTLRKRVAYEFLDRLIYMALLRIRDFRGYSCTSFDKHFNFAIGIKEHIVFPELKHDKIHKPRGLDICVNTKGITSKEMAIDLFRGLNFPVKV